MRAVEDRIATKLIVALSSLCEDPMRGQYYVGEHARGKTRELESRANATRDVARDTERCAAYAATTRRTCEHVVDVDVGGVARAFDRAIAAMYALQDVEGRARANARAKHGRGAG